MHASSNGRCPKQFPLQLSFIEHYTVFLGFQFRMISHKMQQPDMCSRFLEMCTAIKKRGIDSCAVKSKKYVRIRFDCIGTNLRRNRGPSLQSPSRTQSTPRRLRRTHRCQKVGNAVDGMHLTFSTGQRFRCSCLSRVDFAKTFRRMQQICIVGSVSL